MNSLDKMRRAGLVNRVRRDLANWEFHLAGMHDQKSHGSWATGGVLGDEGGVSDFSDTFDGFFDPHKLADFNPAIQRAGAAALAAIDSVHGLEEGFPKVIAMVDNGEWLGSDDGSLGAYMPPEPAQKRDMVQEIIDEVVSVSGEEGGLERGRVVFRGTSDEGQMANTLVHELGHHLTLGRGVDDFRTAMVENEALADLMSAIRVSGTGRDLENIENNMIKAAAEQGRVSDALQDQLGFVQYLRMPEEMFARAYSQYIAVKTGHPAMIEDLNRVLTDENTGGIMQWPPSEFGPISDAMEAYLESRGLLRK